ncbi:MAG: inosine/xanthosine triphosphatase [Candidatus Roizmanbacteria bacterium]|nr:inosine/xanthosine triphosphatase [Candidatus Roizmanbacteria bacterium]
MIVAVGSMNPTKINPVREVFLKHFPDTIIKGITVPSGVAEQPMDIDAMYKGALTRAKNALKKVSGAEYGVGIEGGLHKHSFGWFEHSIVVIINKKGHIGVGASGGLVLPEIIMDSIHKGKNLEEAIDAHFKTTKIGEGIGMFGILTKGVVTRSEGVRHGVAFALARFLHEKVYEAKKV